VQLNDEDYDASPLTSAGIEHHQLIFTDCSTPSDGIVDAFLRCAEDTPGVVAVHCFAGLGRTGTLIALYLMKHEGFTAKESIAWLRIVRPGSVIGPQQQYLETQEACMRELGQRGAPGLDRRSGKAAPACEADVSAQLAEQISKAMHFRDSCRFRVRSRNPLNWHAWQVELQGSHSKSAPSSQSLPPVDNLRAFCQPSARDSTSAAKPQDVMWGTEASAVGAVGAVGVGSKSNRRIALVDLLRRQSGSSGHSCSKNSTLQKVDFAPRTRLTLHQVSLPELVGWEAGGKGRRRGAALGLAQCTRRSGWMRQRT